MDDSNIIYTNNDDDEIYKSTIQVTVERQNNIKLCIHKVQ